MRDNDELILASTDAAGGGPGGLPVWVQVVALGVAVLLLAFDVVILWLSAKERSQRQAYIRASQEAVAQAQREAASRDNVIEKLLQVTHLYTRAEYETLIVQRVEAAEDRILCFWFSLNLEESGETYQRINEAFSHACDRKVVIRVITAKKPERLGPAYELRQRDVSIAFQETLIGDDLRFMLVDRKGAVLGLPADSPEGTPSRLGIALPGWKLTALLFEYFEQQWREAEEYDDYLASIIKRQDALHEVSSDMLSNDLRLPLEEIERVRSLGNGP